MTQSFRATLFVVIKSILLLAGPAAPVLLATRMVFIASIAKDSQFYQQDTFMEGIGVYASYRGVAMCLHVSERCKVIKFGVLMDTIVLLVITLVMWTFIKSMTFWAIHIWMAVMCILTFPLTIFRLDNNIKLSTVFGISLAGNIVMFAEAYFIAYLSFLSYYFTTGETDDENVEFYFKTIGIFGVVFPIITAVLTLYAKYIAAILLKENTEGTDKLKFSRRTILFYHYLYALPGYIIAIRQKYFAAFLAALLSYSFVETAFRVARAYYAGYASRLRIIPTSDNVDTIDHDGIDIVDSPTWSDPQSSIPNIKRVASTTMFAKENVNQSQGGKSIYDIACIESTTNQVAKMVSILENTYKVNEFKIDFAWGQFSVVLANCLARLFAPLIAGCLYLQGSSPWAECRGTMEVSVIGVRWILCLLIPVPFDYLTYVFEVKWLQLDWEHVRGLMTLIPLEMRDYLAVSLTTPVIFALFMMVEGGIFDSGVTTSSGCFVAGRT